MICHCDTGSLVMPSESDKEKRDQVELLLIPLFESVEWHSSVLSNSPAPWCPWAGVPSWVCSLIFSYLPALSVTFASHLRFLRTGLQEHDPICWKWRQSSGMKNMDPPSVENIVGDRWKKLDAVQMQPAPSLTSNVMGWTLPYKTRFML